MPRFGDGGEKRRVVLRTGARRRSVAIARCLCAVSAVERVLVDLVACHVVALGRLVGALRRCVLPHIVGETFASAAVDVTVAGGGGLLLFRRLRGGGGSSDLRRPAARLRRRRGGRDAAGVHRQVLDVIREATRLGRRLADDPIRGQVQAHAAALTLHRDVQHELLRGSVAERRLRCVRVVRGVRCGRRRAARDGGVEPAHRRYADAAAEHEPAVCELDERERELEASARRVAADNDKLRARRAGAFDNRSKRGELSAERGPRDARAAAAQRRER